MTYDPKTHPNRDDFKDAVGWLYATHHGDSAGRYELARVCDPTGLVDALTAMLLGLADLSTGGRPEQYLDHMRSNMDRYIDMLEGKR